NTYDEYWQERAPQRRLGDVEIPVFSIGLWGKRSLHLRGNIRGYEAVGGPKWLRIESARDAWSAHHMFSDQDFHERVLLPFYDRFLKQADNDFESSAPVTTFIFGPEAYHSWEQWPPPAVDTTLYLAPGPTGSVSSLNDGALTAEPPAGSAS